ncbi:MAG: hypothetical protein JTT11_07750 [Candidatus Brockarchaeota archaeon]|nr:hypothetical protein [Candidatus Brockarchaeota archaeon]
MIPRYTAVEMPFDYDSYLDLLKRNNHNFIRLWRWELTTHEPQPWLRVGPGNALDGRPKFDLKRFNQSYFDRLRSRVEAAGKRGMYVSVMLFEDWIFMEKRADHPLELHPFHKDNNINGIDGDPNGDGWGVEIHTLQVPEVVEIQKEYVGKVIETVNDLDNVLYEVCNEGKGHTKEWQYEMIKHIKDVEAGKRKQHPVGMTSVGDMNEACLNSPADWTSLATVNYDAAADSWSSSPPAADGRKVDLLDTDHIGWKIFMEDAKFTRAWVWKSFTRGHNALLMENLSDSAGWIAGRAAMGHARQYSERVDLANMRPVNELSSTGYCLANPGSEYLVYQPESGTFAVKLEAGSYRYEWFNPRTGSAAGEDILTVPGGSRSFIPPFGGDAVLFLKVENLK